MGAAVVMMKLRDSSTRSIARGIRESVDSDILPAAVHVPDGWRTLSLQFGSTAIEPLSPSR